VIRLGARRTKLLVAALVTLAFGCSFDSRTGNPALPPVLDLVAARSGPEAIRWHLPQDRAITVRARLGADTITVAITYEIEYGTDHSRLFPIEPGDIDVSCVADGRPLPVRTRPTDPLGLIMVDIDHFKNFNDSYGHIAGDMLLRGIGEFFKESIRREDIACRFGGEEFVLILPGSSLENTLKRAEQIHEDIRKIRIRHKGSYIDSVQVSMGVVVFSEHGNSAEVLLESADKALYRAKSEGRNKIVVA